MAVKHAFVSAIADEADATLVRPSNWNDDHTIEAGTITLAMQADIATASILGRSTAATGVIEVLSAATTKSLLSLNLVENTALSTWAGSTAITTLGTIAAASIPESMLTFTDITTGNASTSNHGFLLKLSNVATQYMDGTGAWSTPTASVTLDGVSAAVADQAGIANADWNIVWNWQKTTNSEIAFTFGESVASTNGTSTSGVPNQILAKFITKTGSTMSSASFWSRGVHVFSVSPTTAQLLFTDGSASAPSIAGSSAPTTGISFGGAININKSGLLVSRWNGIGLEIFQAGSSSPLGGYWSDLGIAAGTQPTATLSTFGMAYAGSDTSGAQIGGYKARGGFGGGFAAITSGDDMLKLVGEGRVGGTNGWQMGAFISLTSTGTISDSATGIGGMIKLAHAIVGAEPVVVATVKSQHIIHSGTAPTITAGGGTNPTIVGADEAFEVTIGTGDVATSVEVTFGNAFTTNAPICVVQSDTDIVPFKCVTTVTKVTITATLAFTAGSILHVVCRGWE
ncbi:MAG: hypothetical protein Q7R68_10930 [Nitrospirales bacterium]|nr:hypothetical protein [Nitrospirales bacterium]